MCEEESDDTEAVAKLLEINDSIHRTIERYRLVKKGDLAGAAAIPQGTLGISGMGVKKGRDNELSLIDFGGADEASEEPAASSTAGASGAAPGAPAPKGNALEDDLLGLSMGDGQVGAISLGSSNGLLDLARPSANAYQSPQTSQASKPATPSFPTTQPAPQAQKPNYDPFGIISASHSTPKPQSPAHPPQLIGQPAPQPQKAADPFGALASPPRQSSPFQFQQSVKPTPAQPTSSSLLGDLSSQVGSTAASSTATPRISTDDEWTFSSALPEQPQDLTVTNSSIRTVFHVSRPSNAENYMMIESRISNNTATPISDLTFQLAVTKVRSALPILPRSRFSEFSPCFK